MAIICFYFFLFIYHYRKILTSCLDIINICVYLLSQLAPSSHHDATQHLVRLLFFVNINRLNTHTHTGPVNIDITFTPNSSQDHRFFCLFKSYTLSVSIIIPHHHFYTFSCEQFSLTSSRHRPKTLMSLLNVSQNCLALV